MREVEAEEAAALAPGLAVEDMLDWLPDKEVGEVHVVLEVLELTSPREAEEAERVWARSTRGTRSGLRSRRSTTRDSGTTRMPSITPGTGGTISQVENLVLLANVGLSLSSGLSHGHSKSLLRPVNTLTGLSVVEFSAAEDWDNDEYTGSLSDTKVFTPSGSSAKAVGEPVNGSVGHSAPGGNDIISLPDSIHTDASSSVIAIKD